MNPAGRFVINEDGNKIYFLWNGTETYYEKLRIAYKDILNDVKSEYLYFSFFTLCASTLEYSLNHILINYSIDAFGYNKYKTYFETYINIPFRKKLLMLPYIISNGKYVFNENYSSYKVLEELITLRNKILHNKDFLNEYEFSKIKRFGESTGKDIDSEHGNVEFEIPFDENFIDTLTKDKCLIFGDALGDFRKYIMTPFLSGNLIENKMVIYRV